MKLPSSINIFGANINILESYPCLDDDGNLVEGYFCSKTLTIAINKKLSSEDKLHTLIHEIGHAMFFRTSLWQTSINSQLEEIIVNNMATAIVEVFNLRFKGKS